MALCGDNKNPLQHNGTSQQDRLLAGLQSGYVQVDERTDADNIMYAAAYAQFINYFDETNTAKGDWKPFFTTDISATLAAFASQNIDAYKVAVKQRFYFLKDNQNSAAETALKRTLTELFAALFTLSKVLDNYYKSLPETVTVKAGLLNLIKVKLSPALSRLIAYYKGALARNYAPVATATDWKILNQPLLLMPNFFATGLSTAWYTESSWNAYTTSIVADDGIFKTSLGTDIFSAISHAANHNLFSGIFDTYLMVFAKIIQSSNADLAITLEDWDSHPPHYALFLSFLKLMKFAKQQMNTLTQRHLDFYYKEILRLQPKPAQPNSVHVLVELAKQVDAYVLQQNTLLKAGKDSNGKEVLYGLKNETVFNKATVADIKTLYKATSADDVKDPDTKIVTQTNAGRLFAAPVANSADGLGAALKGNNEWHPYINKVYENGVVTQISMPKANVGFAIASHLLYLAEGERKVYLRLVLSKSSLLVDKQLNCFITTQKGWLQVALPVVSLNNVVKLSDGITSCIEIPFTLAGNQPATAPYSAAVHGGTYNVSTPVVKILLAQNDTSVYGYDDFTGLTVSIVEVRVEVGVNTAFDQTGVKNISLLNDFGPLDSSKPFLPFGGQPAIGSSLVIGSKEIFTKPNLNLTVNIEWKALKESYTNLAFGSFSDGEIPGSAIEYLSNGIWQNLSTQPLFTYSGTTVGGTRSLVVSGTNLNNTIMPFNEEYLPYNANRKKGFIAIKLLQDFGNKGYLNAYTTYLINKSNKVPDTENVIPVAPYTPAIKSIYISYSAFTNEDITSTNKQQFLDRSLQLFNIYPFGEVEQHALINNQVSQNLFPKFSHTNPVTTNTENSIGELYIALANLQPMQSVNLLFQLLDGSTNPLVAKPPSQVQWSFLSNNQWVNFNNQQVSDATLALIQSGIISIIIPEKATTANTILPAGFLWLRASISTAAEAICKFVSINAQAAVASFLDNENADDFLNNPLPPNSISKLKTPEAAIKKITQPYPAFNGKPAEDNQHFYTRVSERLRHKARAITIWDYEHLVLEAFPEIYKVKCLNHTSIETDDKGREITNELKPGNVLIITIPQLSMGSSANPLKPYTNQNILTQIENFLRKKISCHVTLKARQPQFEEVRLKVLVRLRQPYTDFSFYANKLQEDIKKFLSPWAYNTQSDVQFGSKIYKSVLINFIEEQPYVDFVTDVKLLVKISDDVVESGDSEEVVASTSRSILVSALEHCIKEAPAPNTLTAQECASLIATVK